MVRRTLDFPVCESIKRNVCSVGPTVRRSALALPKPSSEGLSKQLWYAGPISQMNKQRSKPDSTGKFIF
jgi:hypothetical protein